MRKGIARTARRSSRRHARGSLLWIASSATLGLLALGAGQATAESVHVETQTISGYKGNSFQNPRSAAPDSSSGPNAGDVYVIDNGNGRVMKFTASGEFLLMWGKEVNEGTGAPDVCTNAGAPTDLCKPGSFAETYPRGVGNSFNIVVDSSSGPSQGDIYYNSGSVVQKIDPNGNPVTSFGGTPFPGAIRTTGGGGGGSPSIFVDSSGNLYTLLGTTFTKYNENGVVLSTATSPFFAATGGPGGGLALDPSENFFQVNNSDESVEKISSAGVDLGRITTGNAQNRGLVFDPATNELLETYQQYPVSAVRAYRFNGSGEVILPGGGTCALSSSGCAPSEEFADEGELNSFNGGAYGLGLNTTNHKLYVADTSNNVIRVYSLINVPKVTTGGTENLTRTSVKLLGHVDPDSAGEVTTCKFEYGLTKAYGSTAPCVPGNTSTPADVSAQLPVDTLTSETTYHYRLVAGNANGNRPAGDHTFTTLPSVGGVTTKAAANVGRLSATLNGSYLGDGVDTSYYFEYGFTTEYGQKSPKVDLGTAAGNQEISVNVPGLYAYSLYHFRFVAENKYGKTVGLDQNFHTLAPELPAVAKTYASLVESESATIDAEVNPGEGLTVYRFEYGPTAEYGENTLVSGPIDPNGSRRVASAVLSELNPGSTYHFRVRVTNFSGTTFGPDETFMTPSPPTIISSSASSVGKTTTTLSAVINPGLSLTTYHFEYGVTTAYGTSTPAGAPVGPDDASHAVTASITGLAPGVEYHFRVVAGNGVGTTFGSDKTFTTEIEPGGGGYEGPKKECKKGFVLKHGKCVRRKPHKHHRRHHRAGGHG